MYFDLFCLCLYNSLLLRTLDTLLTSTHTHTLSQNHQQCWRPLCLLCVFAGVLKQRWSRHQQEAPQRASPEVRLIHQHLHHPPTHTCTVLHNLPGGPGISCGLLISWGSLKSVMCRRVFLLPVVGLYCLGVFVFVAYRPTFCRAWPTILTSHSRVFAFQSVFVFEWAAAACCSANTRCGLGIFASLCGCCCCCLCCRLCEPLRLLCKLYVSVCACYK